MKLALPQLSRAGCCVAQTLLCGFAAHAQPLNLLENSDFSQGQAAWEIRFPGKQRPATSIVAGPQGPDAKALRLTVAPDEKLKKFSVGMAQKLPCTVAPGEKLTARFWARSPEGNTIAVLFQQARPPQRSVLYKEFKLSPEWKACEASGATAEGYQSGETQLAFFLSFAPGTVDLANIELLSNAPPPPAPKYEGRAYYLSPRGDDANDGLSPTSALRTPQRAADTTQPGDAVFFAQGEYGGVEGQQVLRITRSGALGKPIVYAPVPGHRVVLRNRGAWQTIQIAGARHIEIRGLRLIGAADEISLAEARREMNNLKNPRTSQNGVAIVDDAKTPAAYVTVRDCEVSDFGGGGIYSSHSDFLTIENNVVYRCGFWSPYANSGISVYQPVDVAPSDNYKIIVRGNVSFENCNFVPFYHSNAAQPERRKVTDGNGIILDDFQSTQRWGGGSQSYQGRTLVANNVVFRNGGSGIHAFLSSNVDIVHNYAGDNNRHPQLADGQIFVNSCRHARVLNNVLIAADGKPVNSDTRNGEGVLYDYNLYATTGGTPPLFARPLAHNVLASPGLTLANWAAARREINVEAKSSLRGAATPFPTIATDFFGKPRAGTPDIGPFALNPTPIVAP